MPQKKPNHRKPLHARFFEKLNTLSYSQLFLIWGELALLFAFGYFLFSTIGDVQHHGPVELVNTKGVWTRFFDSLYFSVVTATTTGYGDIVPRGFSKILSSIQSITAVFISAVFVAKLVSHRQEIALQEVHRLTFEDVFHNIREGLFILRKDLDGIIDKAETHRKLDAEDWDTLVIAYKQGQSLLTEIPDFYDDDNHLYTLDMRREQLLHEAVHRTLHRVNHTLDVLSKHHIDWISHTQSVKELRELMAVVAKITPLWREKSPYDRKEAFEDILHLKESVTKRIERALPVKE
ncbi:MAG TPA: ion channel [Candidatus Peribacteraceae bacterium]|nr:ion channel [Candidatus Peribacteraceae bacterium]